jgi:hypothetical protein
MLEVGDKPAASCREERQDQALARGYANRPASLGHHPLSGPTHELPAIRQKSRGLPPTRVSSRLPRLSRPHTVLVTNPVTIPDSAPIHPSHWPATAPHSADHCAATAHRYAPGSGIGRPTKAAGAHAQIPERRHASVKENLVRSDRVGADEGPVCGSPLSGRPGRSLWRTVRRSREPCRFRCR